MTANNSIEMKTVVETFIIEETAELIYDNEKLDEWNRLVNELGLEGQTKIVIKDKSPIPYMPINNVLKTTLEILCPSKREVKDYDITPIPVEILSLISLSQKEGHFQKIEIWYDDKDKDPACVGISGCVVPVSKGYTWHHDYKQDSFDKAKAWLKENGLEPYNSDGGYIMSERHYLIGRWADIKRSFKELIDIAKQRYISQKSIELKKQLIEAQRGLDDLELQASEMFSGAEIINNLPF